TRALPPGERIGDAQVRARPPAERHARPLRGEKGPLSGRLALVTGGSRGVGAATVRALAEAGADVVVNYRNKGARAEAVAAEAQALGVWARSAPADITDRAQVAAMVGQLDRIDVLVLNASGGMERDLTAARPNYPMAINRDAPPRPLLRPRGPDPRVRAGRGQQARRRGRAARARPRARPRRHPARDRVRRPDRGHHRPPVDGAPAAWVDRRAPRPGRHPADDARHG